MGLISRRTTDSSGANVTHELLYPERIRNSDGTVTLKFKLITRMSSGYYIYKGSSMTGYLCVAGQTQKQLIKSKDSYWTTGSSSTTTYVFKNLKGYSHNQRIPVYFYIKNEPDGASMFNYLNVRSAYTYVSAPADWHGNLSKPKNLKIISPTPIVEDSYITVSWDKVPNATNNNVTSYIVKHTDKIGRTYFEKKVSANTTQYSFAAIEGENYINIKAVGSHGNSNSDALSYVGYKRPNPITITSKKTVYIPSKGSAEVPVTISGVNPNENVYYRINNSDWTLIKSNTNTYKIKVTDACKIDLKIMNNRNISSVYDTVTVIRNTPPKIVNWNTHKYGSIGGKTSHDMQINGETIKCVVCKALAISPTFSKQNISCSWYFEAKKNGDSSKTTLINFSNNNQTYITDIGNQFSFDNNIMTIKVRLSDGIETTDYIEYPEKIYVFNPESTIKAETKKEWQWNNLDYSNYPNTINTESAGYGSIQTKITQTTKSDNNNNTFPVEIKSYQFGYKVYNKNTLIATETGEEIQVDTIDDIMAKYDFSLINPYISWERIEIFIKIKNELQEYPTVISLYNYYRTPKPEILDGEFQIILDDKENNLLPIIRPYKQKEIQKNVAFIWKKSPVEDNHNFYCTIGCEIKDRGTETSLYSFVLDSELQNNEITTHKVSIDLSAILKTKEQLSTIIGYDDNGPIYSDIFSENFYEVYYYLQMSNAFGEMSERAYTEKTGILFSEPPYWDNDNENQIIPIINFNTPLEELKKGNGLFNPVYPALNDNKLRMINPGEELVLKIKTAYSDNKNISHYDIYRAETYIEETEFEKITKLNFELLTKVNHSNQDYIYYTYFAPNVSLNKFIYYKVIAFNKTGKQSSPIYTTKAIVSCHHDKPRIELNELVVNRKSGLVTGKINTIDKNNTIFKIENDQYNYDNFPNLERKFLYNENGQIIKEYTTEGISAFLQLDRTNLFLLSKLEEEIGTTKDDSICETNLSKIMPIDSTYTDNKIFARIKFIKNIGWVYSKRGIIAKQTLEFYSNIVTDFSILAGINVRKNFTGINCANNDFRLNDLFVVQDYKDKKNVVFLGTDELGTTNTVILDVSAGQLYGAILDGGSWDIVAEETSEKLLTNKKEQFQDSEEEDVYVIRR